MKANVMEDMIIWITDTGDTEIGALPPGVGVERLRFDGTQVVDLGDLSEIWVRKQAGAFELHAVAVPGSQVVSMTYADRKRLMDDAGTIRVKTQAEIDQEDVDLKTALARARVKRALVSQDEINHFQLMLTLALVQVVRGQDAGLTAFLDRILAVVRDIYPLERIEADLDGFLNKLKASMAVYWSDLDDIDLKGVSHG